MAVRSNEPGTLLVARYFCDSADEWAAAGPEEVLRAEGDGGTVAVAMDAKASAAMEEEAREPAGGEALIGGTVHESPTPKHDSISAHDPDWRHSAPRMLWMQKEIEPVG